MRAILLRQLAAGWLAIAAVAAAPAAEAAAASAPEAKPAAAGPALPPALHFTQDPAISDVVPSPSGERLAMIITQPNGRRAAAVLDLPASRSARAVAAFEDANVLSVDWVNDQRLVITAARPGYVLQENEAAIFAVDHDAGGLRTLVAWRDDNFSTGTRIPERTLTYGWFVADTIDDGGDDLLMYLRHVDPQGHVSVSRYARLNTRTGGLRDVGFGMPSGVVGAVFNELGEPRVVRQRFEGRDRLYLREGSGRYTLIRDVDGLRGDVVSPLFLEAGDQLVVATQAGRDTVALHVLDLKTRQVDPAALARLDRYDVDRIAFDRKARAVVGVHLRADRPQSAWFSERLAGVQKAVDAALPTGRFNTVLCTRCETAKHYIVWSESDRHPGEYLLYDHGQRSLTPIGAVRPWITEASQGRRSFHWITARDGLPLPVVVTHPPGRDAKEPLPAVLLVHGGPWVRGADLRWSADAQFFASRGWRVIEPDFRGSTGYGARHFEAGWKQWGQAMQDDLADAAAWAVREAGVDPQRICIYGGSYGGYAALMGPIRHPGVYRCAASFAGVTDIGLMFSSARSDLSHRSKRYTMPELIGDPVADAARLKAASPLQRVAEIKVPVLLAHGTRDERVPREHANAFESAARKAGVAIERVDYHDEGHGFWLGSNHADFLQRLERFFTAALKR